LTDLHLVAFAGGVGGAKLVDGLVQVLLPGELTIIVNTADDFTYLGLHISPDLDTICYTLAGLVNPETGWGRANDTWNVQNQLKEMHMPDWFKLGDSDLATHIARTSHMSDGLSLSQITAEFCRIWGVHVKVLPMSDAYIQTWVNTDEGELGFQEYFVHRKCNPKVKGFNFLGVEKSKPAPGVLDEINKADAIIFCPSNPWVSIDPILSVPGIKSAIKNKKIVAVSPIIGNRTVKGPAAKMFSELGIQPSAYAVADHYKSILDCLFVDNSDQQITEEINKLGIRTILTDILMVDRKDRFRLASEVIKYIEGWKGAN
jgi:LPPG:FO 2-phospho-L-lactate transferase